MQRWGRRANHGVLCALRLASLALRTAMPALLWVLAQIFSTASTRGEARNSGARTIVQPPKEAKPAPDELPLA